MELTRISVKEASKHGVSFICDQCENTEMVGSWVTEEGPEAGIHQFCFGCEVEMEMNVGNLSWRFNNAVSQLERYGNGPFSEEIIEILEVLSDINDDLFHDRMKSLTVANVDKIKVLADKILEVEFKDGE